MDRPSLFPLIQRLLGTKLRIGLLSLALAVPSLEAEVVELEPIADVAFLYSETPPFRQNLLNGGKANIGSSLHSGGRNRGSASLMRFDLSGLPADAKVTKVELLLFPVYSYPHTVYMGEERLLVYQLAGENAEWEEGEGETMREPDTDPITVPGANGAYLNMTGFTSESQHEGTYWLNGKIFGPMDFEGESLAYYPLHETGLNPETPVLIALPVDLIERWRAKPELARAGLALWMESNDLMVEESRFAVFQSREGEQSPRLMITYER